MAEERPEDQVWLDSEAGPVVRPYTVTRGRTGPVGGEFDLMSFVVAMPRAARAVRDQLPEHRAILAYSVDPISVGELAARLDLALGVVRVLLGDLAESGLICIHHPDMRDDAPDDDVLRAVINGLRAL